MKKTTVAVFFGGRSAEHAVSLQSAAAVLRHMHPERYNAVQVGITQEGRWLRYTGAPEHIADGSWQKGDCVPALVSPSRGQAALWQQQNGGWQAVPLHAALPVMHGANGEDGRLQGLLELAGIPIVGCGTMASALCMDKGMAHRLVAGMGIAVPAGRVFGRATPLDEMEAVATQLGWPLFVKPVGGGSSFGVSRVQHAHQLPQAVKKAFGYDSHILLEEAVEGFEVGCAVLGGDTLTVAGPDEVELRGGFFDTEEKYSLANSRIHLPARLPTQKCSEIKQLAAAIYRALGCTGFARVDLFVRPDGAVVFNEVNTIPGFTPHSRYPAMMQAAGIGFGALVDRLIETAVSA